MPPKIMNYKILTVSILLALSLSSCSTYRKALDNISNNHNLISPCISLVTSLIFEKVISEEDQYIKAVILNNLSYKIKILNFEKKPTRQEFESLLIENLPLKTHWIVLASTLGSYYEKSTVNLQDSDVKITLQILKEIATGIDLAISHRLN